MSIRGPKRKNDINCHVADTDCLPFWMKNEKVCRQCFSIGKNVYLCSTNHKVGTRFHKSQTPLHVNAGDFSYLCSGFYKISWYMRYKKEDGSTDYDKIVRELESFQKSSDIAREKECKEESYKGCTH